MQRGLFQKPTRSKTNWTYLIIFIAYLILGYRFFNFIIKYTENIFLWDQWDVITHLTSNNLLYIITKQHNEHRIGFPLLLMNLLGRITSYNNKFETLLIGILILLSSLIALIIKKRIAGRITLSDVFIPFIFLNLYQWENLTWGFQFTFVIPILFLFLSIFLFQLKNNLYINILMTFLALFSTYSSIPGLIVNSLIIIFFIYQFLKNKKKRKEYLFFICLVISISATYFIGYKRFLIGSNQNIKLSLYEYIYYIAYIAFQFNGFFGNYQRGIYTGFITLFIISVIFLNQLLRFIRHKKLNDLIIIMLFIYSFIFSLATSYGRIKLGVFQAYTSRYVTHLIPLYYAIYLLFFNKNYRKIHFFKKLIVFLFVFISLGNDGINYLYAEYRFNVHHKWKSCYLKIEDRDRCTEITQIKIYKHQQNPIFLENLNYLKKNKWNLFKDKK